MVEKAPTRVVCVGLSDQDALIALGIDPVGISYWFGDEAAQGIYAWAKEAYGDGELPDRAPVGRRHPGRGGRRARART